MVYGTQEILMCKSTLEDIQQLMKLIAGPTWEEKIEKKCWVNSLPKSAMAAALAQNPAPELCHSHCVTNGKTQCACCWLSRGLVKPVVFPSHVHPVRLTGGLFTQHKRERARLSLNAGVVPVTVDFHDCTEILENLIDSPLLCIWISANSVFRNYCSSLCPVSYLLNERELRWILKIKNSP